MLTQGEELVIEFMTDDPPYRVFGVYVRQNDEYIEIRGTVGDFIRDRILVPKRNIKMIRSNAKAKPEEDDPMVVDSFMRHVPRSQAQFS